MMTRRRFLTLAGGAGAVLAGGAVTYAILPGESALSGDPVIRYDSEPCAECGMVISDERFAAAIRVSRTVERHFDDPGCMIVNARANPPAAGASYFAHEFAGPDWLDAVSAAYVHAPGVKSPMSYDVVAFASQAAADAYARTRAGAIATWQQLMAELERRG